jgi:succinate dehydrogenase/fumarate reductase flavoprotein subunit
MDSISAWSDSNWQTPATWDYETDVLVIGYGGAGVWAAITAAEEGSSHVLVLEKAPVRGGGNSSINLGEFTLPNDADGCFEYIKAFCHGLTPDAVIRAWADEAVRNGEYATRWGLPWRMSPGTIASGKSSEYPFLPGADAMGVCSMEGFGVAAWEILDKARRGLGVEVIFGAHDEELIQDPTTGEILGVWTCIGGDDAPKAIKARRGVVMTIGGFEFNDELKRKYLRIYPADGFYGWPFNTGDGIGMVQKVGAQLWHMSNMIGGGNFNAHDAEYPFAMSLRPKGDAYIWVDRRGNRWRNEIVMPHPHVGWHEFEGFDESICDFGKVPTWAIIDHTAFAAGRLGPRGTDKMARGMYASGLPREVYGWEGWSEDNVAELDKGWLLTGNTLDELVQQILTRDEWMDAEVLKATVERYNSYCAAGDDLEFGRPAQRMLPLETPPFYAWPIYPGGCSTLGGPEKNEHGQVLDTQGEPIPRLYAAGCFGNIAGHTYGIAGGNNAENMVWGRICARHASSLQAWDVEPSST